MAKPTLEAGRRHPPVAPELTKINAVAKKVDVKDLDTRVRMGFERIEQWCRQMVDLHAGLPAPHAATHKGGGDSVSGITDPSAITPGQAPDVGHPASGFAPIDHVHDGTLLASLDDLDDLLEAANGMAMDGSTPITVDSPGTRLLLAEILLELKKLNGEIQF